MTTAKSKTGKKMGRREKEIGITLPNLPVIERLAKYADATEARLRQIEEWLREEVKNIQKICGEGGHKLEPIKTGKICTECTFFVPR